MIDSAMSTMPARRSGAHHRTHLRTHLRTHQLDDLREVLRARLLVERRRTDQTLAAVDDFSASYSPEDRELALAVLQRQTEYVSLLERALDRMTNGSYGFCDGCNRPISFDWLSTIPEARHCVGCMRIG